MDSERTRADPPIWVGLENGALVGDDGTDMTDLLFGQGREARAAEVL